MRAIEPSSYVSLHFTSPKYFLETVFCKLVRPAVRGKLTFGIFWTVAGTGPPHMAHTETYFFQGSSRDHRTLTGWDGGRARPVGFWRTLSRPVEILKDGVPSH